MKRHLCPWLAFGLLTSALAAGPSPIPGSSRPDAWARAGQTLTLNVPEVAGRTVNAAGLPATISSQRVTLTIPANTPPGRKVVRFAVGGTSEVVTTREIEVLADDSVNQRSAQLMLNPNLSPVQVQQLLSRIDPKIARLVSAETLPKAQGTTAGNPAPCGATVAVLELVPGVALEDALNALLQSGGNDVWYPDPIGSYRSPAVAQSAASNSASATFNYASVPISPREALGIAKTPTKLAGKGVTIAVLDTGFSPAIDSLGELTGRVDSPLNATIPFDPVKSLSGAEDFWEGHGTQVAILAAGSKNGIATQARVQPIKVCAPGLDGRASCNTRDVLRGLCLALNKVPASGLVLNLSLGGGTPTSAIHAVLNWATRQGAVVVAAGGNEGLRGSPREYPAAFAEGTPTQLSLPLFAVASVTPRANARALSDATVWGYSPFSTVGSYLNISAPGEALDIGHKYLYSGTSFAAPLVAGAAAIAKGARLNVAPQIVQGAMLSPGFVRVFPGVKPMLDLKQY